MREFPKLKKGDAVRIEWSDPQSMPNEWVKLSDKDMRVVGCITVGQVHRVFADRLTVVFNWDTINKHANGAITIQFVAMTTLDVLS